MNSNHLNPPSAPTARCRAIAALLPLLDAPDTDAASSAEALAHLSDCAYCQAQRAAYRRLDVAARRYLAPPAVPRYRAEDIMSDILGEISASPVTGQAHAPLTPIPAPTLPPALSRPRRFLSGLASLAAVLVIAIIAASLFYARAHPQQTGVPSGFTPAPGSESELLDVAMVSANEGWAVGYSDTPSQYLPGGGVAFDPSHETVLLMHYLHGVWSQVHLSIHGRLTSISMLSAADGWATGFGNGGIFLHYDGHTWRQVPTGNYLFHQMRMLSDTDGWAVSGPVDHYDGHQWKAQPIPASLEPDKNYVLLQGVSMTSSADGWAVGFIQKSSPQPAPAATQVTGTGTPVTPVSVSQLLPDGLIMHYSGGQWTVNQIIPGAELKSVVMTSPDEGWAVGRHDTETTEQVNGQTVQVQHSIPLLLHYQQGAWSEVPDPLDAASSQELVFEHILMLSALDGWIIIGSGIQGRKSATLSYDGTQWQVTRLPIKGLDTDGAGINSISMGSSNDGWAVGSVASTKIKGIPAPYGQGTVPTVVPLLLHYQNNAWTVYNL